MEARIREFEGGVKVRMEYIDPDYTVSTKMPDENEWRWAGTFSDDGILFIKRFTRHLHRILNSFGLSAFVVEWLSEEGLRLIVLNVEDTREVFEITLEKAKIEGCYKFWKDQGFDRQLFVPITLWDKKR